jgi:hypothetical protein
VKFAELVGSRKSQWAPAAMQYHGNRIELAVGPVGIHDLAYDSKVAEIILRLDPEIRHETSGLIDQLPGSKLSDATDARWHGLKKAVEDEVRGIYNPAQDFLRSE